jgi:hypothetical protein
LFLGATALTAVNDNALITVIANAPNPAGQALPGRSAPPGSDCGVRVSSAVTNMPCDATVPERPLTLRHGSILSAGQ